jgi:cytochrome P450
VNELIDKFEDRGHCDVHEEYATPLPSGMFLALMGMPMSDLPMFLGWRDDTIRPKVPAHDFEAAQKVRERVGHEITEYFERMVEERRKNPDDTLLSRIAHAEVEDRPLTREETLGICHLLLLGGLDTVTATLDCALAYLAQHPEQRRLLVDNPDLAPAAVEELLRQQSPVMMVLRVVKEDAELSGVEVKKGDHALVLIGSANADDSEFETPELAEFERESNRHLAFGAGPHRCLGSNLARVELKVALEEWHRRIPDYRLADGAELMFSPGIRQTVELPLVWS